MAPEQITLDVSADPTDSERAAIFRMLAEFNASAGYPGDMKPLSILIRDAAGEIVGGLWGKTVYDWLFVEYLIVPEALRGHNFGNRLMDEAEAIARARGCVGAWLTTFSYQARPFYEARGYQVFGELPRSPRDNVRIFMRKFLDAAESARDGTAGKV